MPEGYCTVFPSGLCYIGVGVSNTADRRFISRSLRCGLRPNRSRRMIRSRRSKTVYPPLLIRTRGMRFLCQTKKRALRTCFHICSTNTQRSACSEPSLSELFLSELFLSERSVLDWLPASSLCPDSAPPRPSRSHVPLSQVGTPILGNRNRIRTNQTARNNSMLNASVI